MAKKREFDIEADCKFGNLSVGAEKATVSVTIERGNVDARKLEELVVGARLDVRLTWDRNGQLDAPGQAKLANTEDELVACCDCPSIQVKRDKLGFRLSCPVGSIDVQRLASAAQMSGHISLTRVGDTCEVDDE